MKSYLHHVVNAGNPPLAREKTPSPKTNLQPRDSNRSLALAQAAQITRGRLKLRSEN
jgi:hypothetical protein